jgi:hypothetical protein
MGLLYPGYPADVQGGDEPTHSPNKSQNSLLGAERGTQQTRRLETDSSNNLYVRIAAIDPSLFVPSSVSALAGGSVTSVTASTLTTILTYTAVAAKRITRIGVSGTDYAKFQLFLNTVPIETKRTGPDRTLDFVFASPLTLAVSDILDIKVTHYAPGVSADFESTIYGA